jgi:hypothetical protein
MTSAYEDLKIPSDVKLRLNKAKNYFRFTQGGMIDEALSVYMIHKGVTFDEISKHELSILTRPATRGQNRRRAPRQSSVE